MTRIRRSAARNSATTRPCSSPSVSGQRAISTRERSTTRDSRPASTLSRLPVATSRNTGVTDNWIVWAIALASGVIAAPSNRDRSEEQTSELQSLMRISYAVVCLKNINHTWQQADSKTTTNKSHATKNSHECHSTHKRLHQ